MNLKNMIMMLLSGCFAINAFALEPIAKEDVAPPAAEGALMPNQIPPIVNPAKPANPKQNPAGMQQQPAQMPPPANGINPTMQPNTLQPQLPNGLSPSQRPQTPSELHTPSAQPPAGMSPSSNATPDFNPPEPQMIQNS